MSKMAYSEAEYSIAIKEMDRYAINLCENIKKYIEVLDFILEKAIFDDAIKAKILRLKGNVLLYPEQINNVQNDLHTLVALHAENLCEADKIALPDKEQSWFERLFQMFR